MGGHPISTTHFTSKMSSGIEGSISQALTLPNIIHTRNGQNYSSLTGTVGKNLNHSSDLTGLKNHNFSRMTEQGLNLDATKKALTKFIKKTIKDH